MTEMAAQSTGRRGALEAAVRWRLPFSRQAWRGLAGNWVGAGSGSSLDFQDHRDYVPGDDPRHIHWQAYARTGALTMKLYRAEVAPFLDVLVDVSASMSLTPEKTLRTDELLAFCVESADRAGAPVRVHAARGRRLRAVPTDDVRSGRWRERLPTEDNKPTATEVPGPFAWRPGAMKVLISDLLYPGDPSALLLPLAATGIGVVLAPALSEEADLPWRGNIELLDCETGLMRRQRIDESLTARYRAAYARHFTLWREAAKRRGVLLAAVPSGPSLALALGGPAFAAGAVEVVG
jgi:uncharacterized protein (DUF58 family)